jgi:hypothetical protein
MLLAILFGVSRPPEAFAEEHVFHSKLVTIHYNDNHLLKEFEKKIRPGALTRTLNKVFLGESGISKDASLGELVDTLFKRVQQILDMPIPARRVHIRIFKNQEEISQAYASITGKPTKAPAFYWQKTNTIYLHTRKLSIGILAHEMGHAVLDHYFVIKPPAKIAEMLTQYVDKEISSKPL